MKNIGIYSPYLDTLGGGERYLAAIAECLGKQNYQVDIFWPEIKIKQQLIERFGFDLNNVNIIKQDLVVNQGLLTKWQITRNYDAFFFLSDGSIPLLLSKNNILHFQVPFTGLTVNLLDRIKLSRINMIICNSKFTQKYIEKTYRVKSQVLYPPVAVDRIKPGKKEKVILAVGRFGSSMQVKNQEVLIDCFRNIYNQIPQWKLVLAGGCQDKDRGYLENLKAKARGLKVEFIINAPFRDICHLYGGAKIFWHAAGYNEDEKEHPERMEHFGIVVVESMAAGCVPVVIGKGGIPEIIQDSCNGFLWQKTNDLEKMTLKLINSPLLMHQISKQAITDCQKFSSNNFCKNIHEIIK